VAETFQADLDSGKGSAEFVTGDGNQVAAGAGSKLLLESEQLQLGKRSLPPGLLHPPATGRELSRSGATPPCPIGLDTTLAARNE